MAYTPNPYEVDNWHRIREAGTNSYFIEGRCLPQSSEWSQIFEGISEFSGVGRGSHDHEVEVFFQERSNSLGVEACKRLAAYTNIGTVFTPTTPEQ